MPMIGQTGRIVLSHNDPGHESNAYLGLCCSQAVSGNESVARLSEHNRGEDIVAGQFLPAIEEGQLDKEVDPHDRSASLLDELG